MRKKSLQITSKSVYPSNNTRHEEGFPIIRQQKDNDCGPTALLMIARFYGMACTYEHICQECHITPEGVSLWSLRCCAQKLEFDTMTIRCSVHDIINLITLPAILYYQERKHYAVVHDFDDGRIQIAAPAVGMKELSTDEFCADWYSCSEETGILLALCPLP